MLAQIDWSLGRFGDRRLDILQRQLHLLVIKPFGPRPNCARWSCLKRW